MRSNWQEFNFRMKVFYVQQDRRHRMRLIMCRIHIQAYLIPEDGVVFIATYREGVTLEAQVHWCIMVPDVGHILRRGKIKSMSQNEIKQEDDELFSFIFFYQLIA